MTLLLSIAAYGCVLCFVFGCIVRVRQYATLPKHLRWELYPVPHEPAQRASHGGSYFEESEYWGHPRRKNRLGELRVMLEEVVTLKSVRLANPSLWWRSQLFHAGIYCSVLTAFILAVSSLVNLNLAAVAWFGRVGLALMLVGSCLLLWTRLRDRNLSNSTYAAHFIQLGAIAVAAAMMLTGSLSPSAPSASVVTGALALGEHIQMPFTLALGIVIAFALVAYIPFSQMAHFIGKYFAYHQVRWDDEPLRGTNLERSFAQNLRYSPTWSASHISAAGERSWADIASENPAVISGAGK